MGLSCGERIGGEASLVTISLTIDFIAPARLGQWLEIRPQVLRASLGQSFCAATIHADDTLCARASATFRAVRKEAAT
jgi:acyl-coenzyme A thioesterase PaaI-like protein